MRCVAPMKSIHRCALSIVLALAAGPPATAAQQQVCYAIQGGDTAAQLAERITGDARNRYQPWFQIVDPVASRFVSKAAYSRIHPGWRVCIINGPGEPRIVQASHLEPAGSRLQSMAAEAIRTIDGIDITWVWLAAIAVVTWLAWWILDDYFGRRKAVLIVLSHFANRFVREFERPLIQRRGAERPVRARLRLNPHRARVDILLAPGAGRRYPNLSDHKKNVEYDVARVLHLLADKSFVRGPVYGQAGWVVVPFHLKLGPK
jgi:hypothetical protein